MGHKEKVELFKSILKRESIESLNREFGEIICRLSSFEISMIEVGETTVRDIVKMCNLHVGLFMGAVSGVASLLTQTTFFVPEWERETNF